MITKFEQYKHIPNVNSLSPEFWKMVRTANWKRTIKEYLDKETRYANVNYYEQAQYRIYKKYEFKEIKEFYLEYQDFYPQLSDYFYDIWLDPKYSKIMPSDDGYTDLISSIIGKGKTFTKSCIDNPQLFIDIAKKEDFIENFGYLLQVDKDEYDNVKATYDPYFRDVRNYNL